MNLATRMRAVLDALATLYGAENRPGGKAAARVLRAVGGAPSMLGSGAQAAALQPAWADAPISGIDVFLAAADLFPWYNFGLEDGIIRADIARQMLTCEIVGPDGMFPDDTLRVGLFYQPVGLNYVTRTHPAEETFVMLAGEAVWTCNEVAQPAQAGDLIHHPSMAPHSTLTRDRPLIAAWRWSGDIRINAYRLIG